MIINLISKNMLPTLLQIGPLSISSMGFFITLALLSASFLIWREAKREYLDEEVILDIFLVTLFFAVIGARVSFILLHPDRFGFNVLRWLLPTWVPGFYLYGGIVFGVVAAFFISEGRRIAFAKFLDVSVSPVLFAGMVYKIGQWLDGSLVGIETRTFFGLPVVGESGRFIPVALLEAAVFLLIFAFLIKTRNYFIVKRKIPGALFLSGVSLTSLVESGVFFLIRYKIYLASFPISLAISVLAFFISSSLLYKKTRSFREDIKILHKRNKKVIKFLRLKLLS